MINSKFWEWLALLTTLSVATANKKIIFSTHTSHSEHPNVQSISLIYRDVKAILRITFYESTLINICYSQFLLERLSFPLSCLNYLLYCILPISMSTSFLQKMNSLRARRSLETLRFKTDFRSSSNLTQNGVWLSLIRTTSLISSLNQTY